MKAFKVFIFGLLYGWFVKVAFDRIYRENEVEDIRNENASLKEHIRTLELKLQARELKPQTRSAELQAKSLESKTGTPTPPEPVQSKNEKDDLKAIKGIGPAIEKKLNNAGILTYDALARLTVEELESILGSTRTLVQEASLIKQAKQLARQNHQ